MDAAFEKLTFKKRLKTMLKVDFKRMFTMPLVYIMVGVSLALPILMLVMTSMMGDATVADPTTGVETAMGTFTNVWQAISSVSGGDAAAGMSMDLTTMCNMNLMYFVSAVLVCLFIGEDFKSGYAKNLFTVRSKKVDYVFSKTLVCFVGGAIMMIMFFIGAMLGGAIGGLPFTMEGFNVGNLIGCLFTKVFLVAVFVGIFVVFSVIGKQRTWLSILLSFGVGAFMFMMIPMMTPLNAGFLHVIMTLAGGGLFAVGLGAVSNVILNKTSLV